MANSRSALKRIRQTKVATARNKTRTSALWTWEKKFRAKLADGDVEGARALLQTTLSCYDKAAKVGAIHVNRANRKKARLTAVLAAATES